MSSLISDPAFYAEFPAVGLGLHSIPLALLWGQPLSIVVLVIGGVVGSRVAQREIGNHGTGRRVRGNVVKTALTVLALIALTNAPVVLGVPRQGSPRLFAPTWLILTGTTALVGSHVRWRNTRLLGVAGGLFAAGALLSLSLSVSVRLASADFTEAAAHELAGNTRDGDVIAICDVKRTVTEPAPRGAFSVHEFVYDWAAQDALYFYTRRKATFVITGDLVQRSCPRADEVDLRLSFPRLLAEAKPDD
jgi:hypothetical protein